MAQLETTCPIRIAPKAKGNKISKVNMNNYSYTISLRATHPSRSLSDAYSVLSCVEGFTAGHLANRGDTRQTPAGSELPGLNGESQFSIDLSSKPIQSATHPLDEFVRTIIPKVELCRDVLLELIRTGGQVSLFVGLFVDSNAGVVLDGSLLRELSNLGLGLDFDIYPPDSSEA